jgi:translation elongation factor EF-G
MQKNKENIAIEIPELQIKQVKLKIVGDSPLIVKAFSQKAREEIAEVQQKKGKNKKEAENIWETFINSLHWITEKPTEYTEKAFNEAMENGARFGFPATGIKQCIASRSIQKEVS